MVDERAITKLCGYPICGNSIPDIPEKKYIILAKVNKVYDLTDRKVCLVSSFAESLINLLNYVWVILEIL